jgi:hypothetical protein
LWLSDLIFYQKPLYKSLHQSFSAHLTQRVMWGIAITWRPSSVCKLFQKSSPLKPLNQFKPNLAWIILRGFPLKLCPMTLPTNHHGHHVYK